MLNNLGKFRIVSEVGHGAMGVVYRAEDNLGRSVALKVLPPRLAGDPELVQRFNREARSAAGLKHPNIVVIYESSQVDDTSFIAMEFIEGESLDQIISSRKAVTIIKKLDIIIQTCRGLQYAHKRQIVHRDVKPSNIMVEHDGSVKIVDFGIAHLGGGTLLTLGGQILGTPSYMSPEQTQGRAVDARSDIFSIGVVLFELLTYQKPFPGDDVGTVWYKIQNEQPPPLSELLPTCPPALQKVVTKALAKNREDRYQTAEDLGFALQQVSDYFKHDMIEVYVQEGRRFLEEGNLTVAKESIQRALEIDSGHDVARSLFDQVQERIEARRRAQRVEQVLRQAKEALQASQLDQAIALLDEVLQLDPAREEARQYKTLAVERRERAQKISQRMERAEKLAADADLKGAKKELEALLALDGAHSAAQRMLDWVLKELTEQERQRQVRQYTQDARNHLARKNFDQARELLEKALALDPINIEVEAALRQIRTGQEREKERQRREGRMAGIHGALKTQDFGQAAALAEQALEEFPGDPQVLKLHAQATRLAELEKRRRQVEEQLQLARNFFQKDQYGEAVNVLQRALERVPNDVRLTSYLKTVQEAQQQAAVESLRREAIRKAGALIRERKFALAIGALEGALARAGESPEILEVLQFAREQQAEQQKEERIHQVLAWAQICLHEQNFEEALRVLKQARRESTSADIDALLATAGEQQQQFEQRRVEMIRQARRSLEAGEAVAAVTLLEAAPKAYLKNEEFRQLCAQCREGVNRATFVRITTAELEKAEAEGDLEQAKNLLQQALQAYPNEPALLAAQERLRAEELRLRRIEWRKLINEAKVAVGRMEYERAVGILTSLPPELAKAPELASEVRALQEEVRQRTHELALHQQAIQAANEQIRNNQFARAIATLEKASAEAGPSPELTDLLRFAREQRDERVRQAQGEAQAFLRGDDYEEALSMLERAQKELGASEISALLASAQDQQRKFELRRQETLQQAHQLLEAGDAGKAVALLDAAPKAYLKNEECQRLHARCREGLERAGFISSTLAQIESCLERQDLIHAQAALRQALRRYPQEPGFLAAETRLGKEQSRLRRTELTKLVDEARAALSRADYGRALEVLKSLPPELAEEPDLASEARTLQGQVRQGESQLAARRQALREAKEHISGNNFSAAIEILEKAVAVAGQSAELTELLQYARERKTEQDRQELVRQLLAQAHHLQHDHNYEDAARILEQAQSELGAAEIGALLATVREQQRQFEERQKETLAHVRQLLEADEAAKAQAVLDAAPKAYFKKKEFSQIYAECKERGARSVFVRSNLKQFEEYIGVQDFNEAGALLERALQAYPHDAALLAAQKRVEEARLRWRQTQWCKVIDEAKVALGRRAYQRAIDLLVALPPEIAAIPELALEVAALLDEARQSEKRLSISREAVRVAREQLQAGEYLRAIETLEKALAVVGQSTELAGLLKLAREQAEQVRQERIRRVLDQAHQLQRDDNYEEAVSLLEQAQRESGAKEIDSLLSAVKEQRQLARQRDEILQQARQLLAAGEAAQAVALLDTAPKAFLENDELRRIYAACRERLERANFISSDRARIEALLSTDDVAQAKTLLHRALKKYPDEPTLLALQERLQQEESRLRHAEWMKQLLAIEQKISSTKRSKLEGLAHQVQEIAASYSADDELTTIAARVRQRIEAQVVAPAAPRKPLPRGRVALGVTAAAALVAAIELVPRLVHKRTVPVEIRSDPPGASVRIGDRSCTAPNCKFELLPGRYPVQAELDGFKTLNQTLILDSQQRPHSLDLTLQPVPRPVQPSTHAVTIGTLVVRAGLPDAFIYVDNQARGRTDAQGVFSAKLEEGSHQVRVQKSGYEAPREQQVDIAGGESQSLKFSLAPQQAKLDLRGAPAGVEIRSGTTLLGRTDGSPSFAVSVPPGDQRLQVAQGPLTRAIAQQFGPGQTRIVDWQSVAPQPPARPPQPPSPGELEAQDWDRVRNAPDATQLEGFLAKYPNGPHAAEAQSKLQDLVWERTDRDDVGTLQGYLNRFPNGPHSGEASRRIDDILWSKVDKRDRQALSAFMAERPNSTHRSEAQLVLSQLEKPQETPRNQPPAPEVQAISAFLGQFNAAFEHKRPHELKQIWPTIPDRYIEAMQVPGATFVMALHPTGEAEVKGDAASIPCQLITRTTVSRGRPSQTQAPVTVYLSHKTADRWTIVNVVAPIR
jgi:serine/threonine-protein kinase